MPLVKFTGNYVEVINALALPAVFYGSQTVEAYKGQITKDLPRTAYASFSSTSDELKERLRQTDNLTTYSFTQGNFDGGVFTELKVNLSELFITYKARIAAEKPDAGKLLDNMRLCYVDDNGTINGFAVTYLRDDSNLTIEESQRPRIFAAVVIQNAAAALEDRKVSYFSHKTLLSDNSINNGKEISDADFVKELGEALNSKPLSTMLEHMFDGEQLSLQHFNALSARIKANRNIDNRDAKQLYFERYYQFAHDRLLTNAPQLQQELEQIKRNATDDANFFADKQFNEQLINIYKKINTALDDNNLKAMNKLNLWIIQLQLRASLCTSNQAIEQQALNLQVQRLLTVINTSETNMTPYYNRFRKVKTEINRAESRIRKLHERAEPYEALYAGSAFTAFMTELKSIDYFNEGAFQETLTYFAEPLPQQVEAKIDELHQSLVQQIQTQARQLQAIAQGANDVPGFIQEAFLSKVAIMAEQSTSLTPLELARKYADVATDRVIRHIFSTIEQEQRLQITDEARTRTKQLPVVEAPKADNRNFVSRNLLSLGVVTAGILLTAGLILIATGVLAPIGIAFAGLALIATIVAAAVTFVAVAGAGIKIARDEIKRTNDFDLATQLHNDYNNKLKQIETDKQTRINGLKAGLQSYEAQINQLISSAESQAGEQALAGEGLLADGLDDDNPKQLLQSLDQQLTEGAQQVDLGGEINVVLPQQQLEEPQRTVGTIDEREHHSNGNANHTANIS